jgi:phytoene dehydrogenase-like protein
MSAQAFTGGEVPAPWPGEAWMQPSLADALGTRFTASSLRLHLAADATAGRAVSPVFPGTALHLLAPGTGRSGLAIGGLGGLGSALAASARNAGAELRLDSAVQEIAVAGGRAAAIVLASGAELRARAIVSALDLRQTFMGLLRWKRLNASEMRRVAQFRMAGQRARVLFALDAPPEMPFVRDTPELASAPIHVVSSMDAIARSYESWAYGAIPDSPPVTLRVPSFVDPRLAPVGKAVMTATVSAIPARLIEGAWDDEKRKRLAAIALVAADRASPGLAKHVLEIAVLTPADIEANLGLSEGDFEGGVLTPDQVLGARPFPEWIAGRTPVRSLYLAGPSAAPAPFLLGASGERAARSVLADLTRAPRP